MIKVQFFVFEEHFLDRMLPQVPRKGDFISDTLLLSILNEWDDVPEELIESIKEIAEFEVVRVTWYWEDNELLVTVELQDSNGK